MAVGLLRYQIFLAYGCVFFAAWRAAVQREDMIVDALDDKLGGGVAASLHVDALILYAPIWAVVALGLYAVGSIAYGVATFSDCPEAAAELDRQIKEARVALKEKGVKL